MDSAVDTQHTSLVSSRERSLGSKMKKIADEDVLKARSARRPYLVDLLLVQVEDLSGGRGGDLLVGPVARLRAVATVPRQDEHHLGEDGFFKEGV